MGGWGASCKKGRFRKRLVQFLHLLSHRNNPCPFISRERTLESYIHTYIPERQQTNRKRTKRTKTKMILRNSEILTVLVHTVRYLKY